MGMFDAIGQWGGGLARGAGRMFGLGGSPMGTPAPEFIPGAPEGTPTMPTIAGAAPSSGPSPGVVGISNLLAMGAKAIAPPGSTAERLADVPLAASQNLADSMARKELLARMGESALNWENSAALHKQNSKAYDSALSQLNGTSLDASGETAPIPTTTLNFNPPAGGAVTAPAGPVESQPSPQLAQAPITAPAPIVAQPSDNPLFNMAVTPEMRTRALRDVLTQKSTEADLQMAPLEREGKRLANQRSQQIIDMGPVEAQTALLDLRAKRDALTPGTAAYRQKEVQVKLAEQELRRAESFDPEFEKEMRVFEKTIREKNIEAVQARIDAYKRQPVGPGGQKKSVTENARLEALSKQLKASTEALNNLPSISGVKATGWFGKWTDEDLKKKADVETMRNKAQARIDTINKEIDKITMGGAAAGGGPLSAADEADLAANAALYVQAGKFATEAEARNYLLQQAGIP